MPGDRLGPCLLSGLLSGRLRGRLCRALSSLLVGLPIGGLLTLGACALAGGRARAATPEPPGAIGWWTADSNRLFPERAVYPDATGVVTVIHLGGPVATRGHPFFTSIGRNGRACITCHQPADGMSVAARSVAARWTQTRGKDPIFAAIDGSNCPSQPQQLAASHSLLLTRGLFRIARPWPPRGPDGRPIVPQFTIEVMHDPTGCNLDPVYGLGSAHPMVSVYRRPRQAANLKYVTSYGFTFDPKSGLPLAIDPTTGLRYAGNLLADRRARTLQEQALDALRTHLQRHGPLDGARMRAIIDFESHVYVAQSVDRVGGSLTDGGAQGGPDALAAGKAAVLDNPRDPQWAEFADWANERDSRETPAQRAFRASVIRGIDIFNNHTFLITDSAGLNSMNFGNPTRNTCSFCHNMTRTGMDVAPGQVDLGTTNEPFADPAPDLPLFKLTCHAKYPPQPFLGRVVYTHDPGLALTTGRCADIGRITIQDMRGLATRPPYFSNGSARTLRDIVDFYDRRYHIGFTEQDKEDLVHLLGVL